MKKYMNTILTVVFKNTYYRMRRSPFVYINILETSSGREMDKTKGFCCSCNLYFWIFQ